MCFRLKFEFWSKLVNFRVQKSTPLIPPWARGPNPPPGPPWKKKSFPTHGHDICLTSKSFYLLTVNGVLAFWAISGIQIFHSKIDLIDDIWPSTSGGIFLTDHALDSGEQTNILSIRWNLSSLVLWTPPEVPLTPILLWLFFVDKSSTVYQEKALPSSAITSNQWLSPAVHPIILRNWKNFLVFEHISKKFNLARLLST